MDSFECHHLESLSLSPEITFPWSRSRILIRIAKPISSVAKDSDNVENVERQKALQRPPEMNSEPGTERKTDLVGLETP
ncbi:hypothetical protein, partial [Streptomyces sp. NPDC001268]|uniref:hypothetical protein n=1 Tax=Streptomyces sp. NPDC001268 TaxID=3364553 RepID=UPI0036BE18C3